MCSRMTWTGGISFSTAVSGHRRWVAREVVLYLIDVDRVLQAVLHKHCTASFHAVEQYCA